MCLSSGGGLVQCQVRCLVFFNFFPEADSRGGGAGGMFLAVTQEDFLVLNMVGLFVFNFSSDFIIYQNTITIQHAILFFIIFLWTQR